MPLDRDDALTRVSKVFARLEGAEPPAANPFKQHQADSTPPATRPNTFPNREAWLLALLGELRSPFKRLGRPIPERVRIGVGFPSVRGIAAKEQRIGECWSSERSGDDHHEIIISPVIADPMRVAGVLAHELIHAAVGAEHGHKGPFREVAHGLGLEGRMTATTEGDAFKRLAQPILDALGPYPHAVLLAMTNGRKKQATRLIKCECPECGYVARVARQWLDGQGAPHCPAHGPMTIA
jgi:SprT-like family